MKKKEKLSELGQKTQKIVEMDRRLDSEDPASKKTEITPRQQRLAERREQSAHQS